MKQTIEETTRLLLNGTLSKDDADKILLDIYNAASSYAIVRWLDNDKEDVVCKTKEIAEEYVRKYNELSGSEQCYLDEEIWLPLSQP